jgi:hypothetical protein
MITAAQNIRYFASVIWNPIPKYHTVQKYQATKDSNGSSAIDFAIEYDIIPYVLFEYSLRNNGRSFEKDIITPPIGPYVNQQVIKSIAPTLLLIPSRSSPRFQNKAKLARPSTVNAINLLFKRKGLNNTP